MRDIHQDKDCAPLEIIRRFLKRGFDNPDSILLNEIEECKKKWNDNEELMLLNSCLSYFYEKSSSEVETFRQMVSRLAVVLDKLQK